MSAGVPFETRPVLPRECSILIILMGSLGDVARGMAVPAPLKKAYPECRLTWLVEPKCLDLIRGHGLLDEILVFQRGSGLKALRELRRELARHKFDIALDLQRHFKSGFFSWLSAANRRIGFHPGNAKEFNWIFNNEYVPRQAPDFPKISHYLEFCRSLAAPVEEVDFACGHLKGLPLPEGAESLSGEPFVALVCGSSRPSKNWTLEGYCDLARHLALERKLRTVIVGDRNHRQTAAEICSQVNSSLLMNLAGQTSLHELIAVISRARAGIGPDSGPGHLASLFKVPYVSIFGPTSPRRVAPYGSEDLVVRATPDQACLRAVSAEMVLEKLDVALARSVPD